MNKELRDLYDDNRNLTGEVIEKGQEVPDNRNILVVMIWIKNANNKFLIQKRSQIKGGKWGATGGHPKHGESSIEGIITETKEEIGLNISDEKFILYYSSSEPKRFFDLYYLEKDINITSLTLQKEEVSEVKWATIEEIEKLYMNDLFKDSHYMTFKKLLEYFEKQK